ncbi:hypothetical protein EV424DRAFT_1556334 [Suillus variegatus]|nr:hypothetical protein EV424DRAFT_1556334 [Suillus variegatus]
MLNTSKHTLRHAAFNNISNFDEIVGQCSVDLYAQTRPVSDGLSADFKFAFCPARDLLAVVTFHPDIDQLQMVAVDCECRCSTQSIGVSEARKYRKSWRIRLAGVIAHHSFRDPSTGKRDVILVMLCYTIVIVVFQRISSVNKQEKLLEYFIPIRDLKLKKVDASVKLHTRSKRPSITIENHIRQTISGSLFSRIGIRSEEIAQHASLSSREKSSMHPATKRPAATPSVVGQVREER